MKEKETDTSNQASSLEQLIADVKQGETKTVTDTDQNFETNLRLGTDKEIQIDVLSLPPRSEVHITKQRTRLHMSKPMKRLIFMLTVLIVLISVSTYYYGEELMELFTN